MTVYELRVHPRLGDTARLLETHVFTAENDAAAKQRMQEFAETLPAQRMVFLWAQGADRSIASEDGRA